MARSDLVTTPHGRVAILELDDGQVEAALHALPDAERGHAATLQGVRRREFITGRTALHELIAEPCAILANDRGAPVVPAHLSASLSHKGIRAAAIVAPSADGHLGIDLERAAAPRMDIARRILTAREPAAEGREVTRIFSIKEAIYKAIDPIVRRYVGFQEVEVIGNDATPVDVTALPVVIEIWNTEVAGFWLSTARATRRGS